MKTKRFIIPVLILALLTVTVAPPVQAELVTLTVILAAALTTAVVTTEVVKSENGAETASKPSGTESIQQAGIDYSTLDPAAQ